MVCMFFTDSRYTKVVYNQCELDGAPYVSPQSWSPECWVLQIINIWIAASWVVCWQWCLLMGGHRCPSWSHSIRIHSWPLWSNHIGLQHVGEWYPWGSSYINICPTVCPSRVFNVNSHVLCIRRTKHTVPQDLGGDRVCSVGGELTWVFDKVSSHCDAYTIRINLLRSIIQNNARICDGTFLWNVPNTLMVQ